MALDLDLARDFVADLCLVLVEIHRHAQSIVAGGRVVVPSTNMVYMLNSAVISVQNFMPPQLCFATQYWKTGLATTIGSNVVCMDGADFDLTNNFAKLVTPPQSK